MTELASPAQLRAAFLRWALVCVPGVMLLGFLSGRVSGSGGDNPWFAALEKPALYPPPATFGIVWTILYIAMGLALALIISARGAPGRGRALALFGGQLVLNLAWSPLFFALHQIKLALGLLVVLDISVALTLLAFLRIRPLAGWMLAPYMAWVLFATVLNLQFHLANPDADGQRVSGAATRVEL